MRISEVHVSMSRGWGKELTETREQRSTLVGRHSVPVDPCNELK